MKKKRLQTSHVENINRISSKKLHLPTKQELATKLLIFHIIVDKIPKLPPSFLNIKFERREITGSLKFL